MGAFPRGAIFASASRMADRHLSPESLRAEARLLTIAGLMLLVTGFPLTLGLVAIALHGDGVSAVLPLAIGAPPIALGYLACHFASQRLLKAKMLQVDDAAKTLSSNIR